MASLTSEHLAQIRNIVGADQVLTELIDLIPYGFDGTAVIKEQAACVVFPGNTQEVSAVVKIAAAAG